MTGDENVSLNYIKWHDGLQLERPYQLVSEDLPDLYGIPRQNFEIAAGPPQVIEDGRRYADFANRFSLDNHGFMFLQHDFPDIDCQNEADVETVYKPLIEELLKQNVAGADEICFFQWRVRFCTRPCTGDHSFLLVKASTHIRQSR
jgi:hypothetical protein